MSYRSRWPREPRDSFNHKSEGSAWEAESNTPETDALEREKRGKKVKQTPPRKDTKR